jgi:hypothetical protein
MIEATRSTPRHRDPASGENASGIIVLGTGRSGTSAITRAFVASGFFAGRDDDLYGPLPSNPVGHYESLSVLRVNEELLRRFGRSWWADAPTPEEQLPLRTEIVPRLKGVLETLIASAHDAPVAVKEPRINSLLPLWQPVIDRFLHPVLAVRDPLEIALSHGRRDGTSMSHALAAWEAQMSLALRWLDKRPVTVAPYERLMAQPSLATDLVRHTVPHLDPTRAEQVRPAAASSALRPDLHHEKAADLVHAEFMTQRQVWLWEYLKTLPAGNVQLEIPKQLHSPSAAAHAIMRKESERVQLLEAHAAAAAGLRTLEARLAEETDLAQQALSAATTRTEDAVRMARALRERHALEIAHIRTSMSWRVTTPLRRAKQTLRRSAA